MKKTNTAPIIGAALKMRGFRYDSQPEPLSDQAYYDLYRNVGGWVLWPTKKEIPEAGIFVKP